MAVPPLPSGLLDGLPTSTAVYDRHGVLLRLTLAIDGKYRLRSPLADYPAPFLEALLLKEDRSFYIHRGVSLLALARASYHDLVARDYRSGASTITMQLVRICGGYDTESPAGKLRQVYDALRLELIYPKRAILEAYCERAPCGGNIEGFGTASLAYFHQPISALSLSQELLLACLPQRPWDAGHGPCPPGLLAARGRLEAAWAKRHRPESGAEAQFSMPIELSVSLPFAAPHAVDSLLRASSGEGEASPRLDSTLDYGLQRTVERVLGKYVERKASIGIHNACALLVDADGMRELAEVGSADFMDPSISGQVNGTEAKRSPGSTLKPFLYSLAIDQGLIHPMSILKDTPIHYSGYNPDNFDDDFEGPITAKDALVRSRNVPAVYLTQRVRNPSLYDFLSRAGVRGLKEPGWYGVSLILGTAEVTMKELVAMYGALANGGRFVPLRSLRGQAEPRPQALLSPEAAWLTLDMLKDRERPAEVDSVLGGAAFPACAWKTGTSIAFKDAWCVGVFGHYILAAWVGDFDGSGNPSFVGLEAAAPLMFEIIDALRLGGLDCSPGAWVDRPPGLARVKVCAASGKIPTDLCPSEVETWFIPGKSPIERCDVHQEIFTDIDTGLRRSAPIPGRTRREVMEVWPSDMMAVFDKAGMPRKKPPPFAPGEGLEPRPDRAESPQIVSPLPKGEYVARSVPGGSAELPLVAIVPSDAQKVFWFLDESYLGSAPRGKPFFWKQAPGSYVLRATDDRGRSTSCEFTVLASD
jgi:penicillin-binding protein 1C